MGPEIEAYVREHGDRYTTKALRGLGAALIVPVIFTLILTGVCMAMFGLPTGAA